MSDETTNTTDTTVDATVSIDTEIPSMDEELDSNNATTAVSADEMTDTAGEQEELIVGKVYLSKFDEDGKRVGTVVSDVHFKTASGKQKYLDEGYIEIPTDIQETYYATNKYYRDPETGEPTLIPDPVIPLSSKKTSLLSKINAYTKSNITGGFKSIAGIPSDATYTYITYDSDEDTQQTMSIVYAASKSADFATSSYAGVVPCRGIPGEATDKQIFNLDASAIQKFEDDLGIHIGTCKQEGWVLQNKCNDATEVDWDTVYAEIMAIVDPDGLAKEKEEAAAKAAETTTA